MTFISPFNLRVAGNTNDSVLINSANYTNAGLTAAFAGDRRLRRHGDRHRRGHDRLHRDLHAAPRPTPTSANFSIQNLNCGGCFAQVDETNHGGTNDSFTLNYNGNTSAPIVNGTNYTAAGILGRAHADPAGRHDRDARRRSAAATSAA